MPRPTTIRFARPLWLAVAIAAAACGSRSVGPEEPASPGSGAANEPPEERDETPIAPERIAHLSLDLEDLVNVRDPDAEQTRVSLVVTDETGSTARHVLGVFEGVCTDAAVDAEEPGLGRPALVGADCRRGDRGSRVRVARDRGEIVALRALIESWAEPDEFPHYDEIQRVEVPEGAEVVTGDPPRSF